MEADHQRNGDELAWLSLTEDGRLGDLSNMERFIEKRTKVVSVVPSPNIGTVNPRT